MLRIGQVEATATQDGKYTDGSVAGGIAATRLRAAAFNAMQEELAHIVESAGLALDINDMTQVLKAIQKLTLSRANPFADIKSDGAAAISTALTNLGLGNLAKQNADNVNITGGSVRTTAGSLYDGSNRVYSDANPGATFSADGVGLWYNVKDMLQVRIGTWSLPAEAGTSTQVAFVQAFTRKCLIVVPIPEISASDQIGVLGMTTTTVTISKGNGDSSPRTGKFIAFGY
ncbi:hypothetical protein [Citrobacter sp. RHB35-C21]|uniref:hypothetical protein n=1 Tax=Citrobacter sp. RHB35-C21 TaxID=2742626 RepID=UPI002016FBC6|nr:hypothetical protein [Citrobacter sp. RHB35-C21]